MNQLIELTESHKEMYKAIDELIIWVEDDIKYSLFDMLKIMDFMSIGVDMKVSYSYNDNEVLEPGISAKIPGRSDDDKVMVYDLSEIRNVVLKILEELPKPDLQCISGQRQTEAIARILAVKTRQEY